MTHKAFWILSLALFEVSCQSTPETIVSPAATIAIVDAETTLPEPTEIINQTSEATETSEVVSAPVQPTAQPTDAVPTAMPATAVPASPVDSIQLLPIANGFVRPLGLEHAFDERLFVVEQKGTIQIVQDGQILPIPFLNIEDRVTTRGNEQGLLGLAFHPNYQTNGRFFLNYTRSDNATVIAEYLVDPSKPNLANPESESIILTIDQPFQNHNGGQIRFGPDGYLYIGMGDGGSRDDPQNHAQDFDTLLGAMLRIDVDSGKPYAIPADNPFVSAPPVRDEIWAVGLRNPWRFSFDKQTGDLFIADVGQNMWEEISFQPAGSSGGENYGWKIYEGEACYLGNCDTADLTPPIAITSHAEGHCSITGGYIYRGQAYPSLTGNYFFADYCSGTLWRLFQSADGRWDQAEIGNMGFLVSSFGEDANGEVYIINQGEGIIYQLIP